MAKLLKARWFFGRINPARAWVAAGTILLASSAGAAEPQGISDLRKAAQREGKVVFYTSSLAKVADAMKTAAERDLGIQVEIVRASSGALFNRFMMEARTPAAQADVIETGILDQLVELKSKGMLAQVAPFSTRVFRSTDYRDPDNYWFASRITIATIIYNKDRVPASMVPRSWLDLTKPEYKGKIIQGHAKSSAISALVAYYMVKLYGWDYYEKLRANEPLTQQSCDVTNFLVTGERLFAPCDNNNAVLAAQQNLPLASVFPDEGVFGAIGPAGVLAKAPHPNAARLFLDWLLSPAGQNIHTASGAISPLSSPEITYPSETPDVKNLRIFIPDINELGKWLPAGRTSFSRLFGN